MVAIVLKQQFRNCGYLGELELLSIQSKIFISEQDTLVEQAMESLANSSIRTDTKHPNSELLKLDDLIRTL